METSPSLSPPRGRLSCHQRPPVSQSPPAYPGWHTHAAVPFASWHVPPFWHTLVSHGNSSVVGKAKGRGGVKPRTGPAHRVLCYCRQAGPGRAQSQHHKLGKDGSDSPARPSSFAFWVQDPSPERKTPRSPSPAAQGLTGSLTLAASPARGEPARPAEAVPLLRSLCSRGNLAAAPSPLDISPRCRPHAQRRGVVSRCLPPQRMLLPALAVTHPEASWAARLGTLPVASSGSGPGHHLQKPRTEQGPPPPSETPAQALNASVFQQGRGGGRVPRSRAGTGAPGSGLPAEEALAARAKFPLLSASRDPRLQRSAPSTAPAGNLLSPGHPVSLPTNPSTSEPLCPPWGAATRADPSPAPLRSNSCLPLKVAGEELAVISSSMLSGKRWQIFPSLPR